MGKKLDRSERATLVGLVLACLCVAGIVTALSSIDGEQYEEETHPVYVAEQDEPVSITGLDFDGTLEVKVLGGQVFSSPTEAGIQKDDMAYCPDVDPEKTVFLLVSFIVRNVDAAPIWETKSGQKLINVSGVINLEGIGDHYYFDGTAAGVNELTEKLYFDLPMGEEREFNAGWFVPKDSIPQFVIVGDYEERKMVPLEVVPGADRLQELGQA